MTCVLCREGETRPGTTTVTFSRDGFTLVVQSVPADVCENCGEAYLDAAATEELLRLARDLRQPGTGVVVREYSTAAA
jgi:YgiT-type zinc finger domain-containing protein